MEISFGHVNDADSIMSFLAKNWKENHIMSINKELFLYEFSDGDKLNIAYSATSNGEITGIFGFKKYSSDDIPEIAGSMWVVNKEINSPMLGLMLRNFVINNTPHRFFAAPGAAKNTRNIYKYIGMSWVRMNQYFILNPEITNYKIIKNTYKCDKFFNFNNCLMKDGMSMYLAGSSEHIKDYCFDCGRSTFPYKDYNYIKKRFFDHPVYKYDVYAFKSDFYKISNIVVCRTVSNGGSSAYRVVDFYGESKYLKYITSELYSIMIKNKFEYIDFLCSGFDKIAIKDAGFNNLDFSQNNLIIPNLFEPFIRENIETYAVHDVVKDCKYVQCKADGDQDRPNLLYKD